MVDRTKRGSCAQETLCGRPAGGSTLRPVAEREAPDGGVAVVCPRHGGGHPRMRERVRERRPDLCALAEQLVGGDPVELLDAGTAYVQPAIFCATVAGWEASRDGMRPLAFAGHSLGEFAALVLAGAMSAEDGLRMVVVRGRACQEAADRSPGGMLILKADAARAA